MGIEIGVQLVEVSWKYTGAAASSAAASSGGVSPEVPPVEPAEAKMPRPIRGSSSSSSMAMPPVIAAPHEKFTFAIYTFGVDKLVGRFTSSRSAREIKDTVSQRGGPPVPIPGVVVFPT